MSTDDLPRVVIEDCKSCVPVEVPATIGSAEESTVDLSNEVSTTDVRVEQSTSSNEDEASGGEGNRWKDCLQPRSGKTGRSPRMCSQRMGTCNKLLLT